jgi:formate dehydrogenase maturation protein FdhE
MKCPKCDNEDDNDCNDTDGGAGQEFIEYWYCGACPTTWKAIYQFDKVEIDSVDEDETVS